MAETEKLTIAAQEIIAAKISRRLATPLNHEALLEAAAELKESGAAVPLVELGETLKVYKLRIEDVERFEQSGGDLRTLAQATGRLHHQIKFAGEATRFAQTRVIGDDAESWPLCELFASPLASQIHAAIDVADELVPDDKVARLLLAPAFRVIALWFCEPDGVESAGDTEVMVVSAPNQFALMINAIIPATAFLDALVSSSPISGFSFADSESNQTKKQR